MATYRQIRLYIEAKYGFVVGTADIAEVKELCGIPRLHEAPNRKGQERATHCTRERMGCIKDALQYYGMV
jgi:hypothetical protein